MQLFDLTKEQLYKAFIAEFIQLEGKKYIANDDTRANLKALILYFTKNEDFINCKNVITKFKIGSLTKQAHPSFDKGLLIVGNFGTGKTSMMRVFEKLFIHTPFRFKGFSANDIVEKYEGCATPADKKVFWQKMNADRVCFDDVKTERIANNYGQANLFKDIIEKRYINKTTTYITCNDHEKTPHNMDAALMEFGEKYGGRVFDRLFEMFNFIEFKGKSLRR